MLYDDFMMIWWFKHQPDMWMIIQLYDKLMISWCFTCLHPDESWGLSKSSHGLRKSWSFQPCFLEKLRDVSNFGMSRVWSQILGFGGQESGFLHHYKLCPRSFSAMFFSQTKYVLEKICHIIFFINPEPCWKPNFVRIVKIDHRLR